MADIRQESIRVPYTIRDARPSDGEAMLDLLPRLADFEIPESRAPEHLWQDDAALLRRWMSGETDDCLAHVGVDDDGNVVGLTLVRLRPELLSGEPSAHLETIAVAKSVEGQGVAGSLLTAAEREARAHGALTMTLHVFAVNTRARGMYEKRGYDGELLRYIKPLTEP